MNPNQALWERGDFTRVAESMRASGDAFVASLGVGRGMKVLDLGCGDGTTALPEAQRGADVLGVDIARNLVEAGNRRAREAGLANIRFQEGDACDLRDLADHSFDLVVTVFGAMNWIPERRFSPTLTCDASFTLLPSIVTTLTVPSCAAASSRLPVRLIVRPFGWPPTSTLAITAGGEASRSTTCRKLSNSSFLAA